MRLSTRLYTIFDVAQPCSVAADIDCGHGLLPIVLIQLGRCEHMYACNIREGPPSRTQEATRQYGLQNSVTTELCDGLQGLEDNVEAVVITGMGYDIICGVLMKGDKQLKHYRRIILRYDTRVEDTCRWLRQNGFTINAEQLVKDHHYYQVLPVHKEPSDTREDQYLFGVYLDRHPLFREYWTYILGKQKIIIQHTQPYYDGYTTAIEETRTIGKKLKELS